MSVSEDERDETALPSAVDMPVSCILECITNGIRYFVRLRLPGTCQMKLQIRESAAKCCRQDLTQSKHWYLVPTVQFDGWACHRKLEVTLRSISAARSSSSNYESSTRNLRVHVPSRTGINRSRPAEHNSWLSRKLKTEHWRGIMISHLHLLRHL